MKDNIRVIVVIRTDDGEPKGEELVKTLKQSIEDGYKRIKYIWKDEAEALGLEVPSDFVCFFLLKKELEGERKKKRRRTRNALVSSS